MGGECILFTYALGLFTLGYGLYVVTVGRVHLTLGSSKPVQGATARLLGCLCVLAAIAYLVVVTWAWSAYDR
jgi:hypothetical protein